MGKVAEPLWQIDEAIYDCFNNETGEVDLEKLEQLEGRREKKLEGIALGIKCLLAEAVKIKAEEDVLKERRRVREKKAENMKNYLGMVLNGEALKTPRVEVTWRPSQQLQIYPNAVVPDEFLKYAEPVADKKGLTAAIKEGRTFPGIVLEPSNNIQIK